MKKQEIEKQYKKLISGIETAKIYDGRGVYNTYYCDSCTESITTLYVDKGVTPYCLSCRCGGTMSHSETFRDHPSPLIKIHKWVRPTLEQTLKLSDSLIEHVLKGGLIFEKDIES